MIHIITVIIYEMLEHIFLNLRDICFFCMYKIELHCLGQASLNITENTELIYMMIISIVSLFFYLKTAINYEKTMLVIIK
jgi:hypothetical protein